MHSTSRPLPWAASVAALAAVVLWDLSRLDLPLARAMGGTLAFPLRNDWFLTVALHSGARALAWVLELALCLQVAWPLGPFARLPAVRRIQIAATVVVASGLIALLKATNLTSCPSQLQAFGGVAHHLPHWRGWFAADGGTGHCFPAGHASTGFAFLGGYFGFRDEAPGIARAWLAGALAAGTLLGLGQQWRGAHFLSHTLWTGWICWMVALAGDRIVRARCAACTMEAAA